MQGQELHSFCVTVSVCLALPQAHSSSLLSPGYHGPGRAADIPNTTQNMPRVVHLGSLQIPSGKCSTSASGVSLFLRYSLV